MQSFQQNNSNLQDENALMNNYAQDYLNTVKENRSLYGNYVDNSLTYDPYKEQKSVYNVVYETDAYNPWGKPGGGAPKIDKTGHVSTKIAGTLKWNLNGETEDDRAKRLANAQKSNKNVLLYKKNPGSPQMTPRYGQDHRQSTTYNYNYRDPYIAPQQPTMNNQPLPPIQSNFQQSQLGQQSMKQDPGFTMTKIEREAEFRNMQRNNQFGYKSNYLNRKNDHELNRVSNKLYNDNQPTVDNPNNPYWFGRTGPNLNGSGSNRSLNKFNESSSEMFDARKRNFFDVLENKIPNYNQSSNNFSNSQYVA